MRVQKLLCARCALFCDVFVSSCSYATVQILMYLRSAKDKRTDAPGDLTLLPSVPAMPDWPLRTPANVLHELAKKKLAHRAGVLSPRGTVGVP